MLIDNVRNSVQQILPSRVFGAVFGIYSSLKTAAHIGVKDCLRLRSSPKDLLKKLRNSIFPELHIQCTCVQVVRMQILPRRPLIRLYHACLRPKFPVSLIVDAAAYAGYTAVFFANKYPDAEIIALEPDAENYSLAQMNLSPYGERVKLLNAAVWYRSGPIRVLPDRRSDSTQVAETTDKKGYPCIGLNMMSLLEKSGQQRISIFKCDIEGAEEFIFSEEADVWIEQTDSILMEIHSARAYDAVYSIMRRHPFKVFTNRELHVFFRVSPSRSLIKSLRGNLH